jgi:hypothetical protein
MKSNECTDAEWDARIAAFERMSSPRAVFVALTDFISLQILNASAWKSLLICFALYIFMRLPLGRRFIEGMTLVVFLAAAFYWLDIIPLRSWAHLGAAKIDLMLTN